MKQLYMLTPGQVLAWYGNTQADLKSKYNRVIPSLAFFHIPFKYSQTLSQRRKKNRATAPGISYELLDSQGNICHSKVACKLRDTPFMDALHNTPGLLAVFSGHNHRVDWCMRWPKSMSVCFGRRTGYGGYDKTFAKGARKIVVYEDGLVDRGIDTWIRLEDGRISAPVTLNATYGTDKYPPAPDQDKDKFTTKPSKTTASNFKKGFPKPVG
jgi:hypothetical protein